MICSTCQFKNPGGHRFCGGCGTELSAEATPRGTSSAPSPAPADYTPRHLADKILRSRSALEGERKRVTVLFADLQGSTQLADQIDPEDLHELLDRYFRILSEGVHRFEGTVNQYTGDGIMAIFGAPIAHEDHAQRACHAALWLRESLGRFGEKLESERGIHFGVRIGINLGEVVVGKIGDDLRMDYTAQGRIVGLAKRMEQLAQAGQIFVTGETARRVEGSFELTWLGELNVRGAIDPLPAYRLEGHGSHPDRIDRSRRRGLSQFVGRGAELEILEQALDQVRAGPGQVIGIEGDAGVGKSRLAHELLEKARHSGFHCTTIHAVSHGRSISLAPVHQIYRQAFGLEVAEHAEHARKKIEAACLSLDPSFEDDLPFAFEFMGVRDGLEPASMTEPAALASWLRSFTRRWLRARTQSVPWLLILDDLHWYDPASRDWLPSLIESARDSRTLLVLGFRPEFRQLRPELETDRLIALEPLEAHATDALLGDLLGSDPSLNQLKRKIAARAAGNPLFSEEIVRSLVEEGRLSGPRGDRTTRDEIDDLPLPDDVHGVLAGRIDQLAETSKALLHCAAVIGTHFPRQLLEEIAGLSREDLDATLCDLTERGMLLEDALAPDITYRFNHPLIQEVAYGTQLAGNRRLAHAAVASALEKKNAERPDDVADMLAHHWEHANHPEFAAAWHSRAAERITPANPSQAARHWRSTLAQLERVSESEERTQLELRACTAILTLAAHTQIPADELEAILARAMDLTHQRDDIHARGTLLIAGATLDVAAGDFKRSLETIDDVLALADRSQDPELSLGAHALRMFLAKIMGWPQELIASAEATIALLGSPGHEIFTIRRGYDPCALARTDLILARGWLEEPETESELRKTLDLADESPSPMYRVTSLSTLAYSVPRDRIAAARGSELEARLVRRVQQDADESEELGSPRIRVTALSNLLALRAAAVDLEGAREIHGRARTAANEARLGEGHLVLELLLAEVLAVKGEPREAVSLTQQVLDRCARAGHAGLTSCRAHLAGARALERMADTRSREAAETHLRRAREIGAELGVDVREEIGGAG